jgi:SET domain-containing protein
MTDERAALARPLDLDAYAYVSPKLEKRARPGGEFVNHSCLPNAGIRGQVVLVAMRAIASDEEITYDYAMSDGSSFDVFACNCGAASCRRRVTGDGRRLAKHQLVGPL